MTLDAARVARMADDITSDDGAMRGMLATARESLESLALGAVAGEPDAETRETVAAIVAQALAVALGDGIRSGVCAVCGRSTNALELERCSRHLEAVAA